MLAEVKGNTIEAFYLRLYILKIVQPHWTNDAMIRVK